MRSRFTNHVTAGALLALLLAGCSGAGKRTQRASFGNIGARIKETRNALYDASSSILERRDRLVADASRLERQGPTSEKAWLEVAEAMLVGGDRAKAEKAFLKAPGPAADYQLGRIYLERSRVRSVKPWAEKAKECFKRSLSTWSGIRAHLASVFITSMEAKPDMVTRLCEEGLKRYGSAQGTEEYLMALATLKQGEEKRSVLKEVLERRPHYAMAIVGLAQVALKAGDRDEVLKKCRAALAVNPRFAEAYLLLGVTRKSEDGAD